MSIAINYNEIKTLSAITQTQLMQKLSVNFGTICLTFYRLVAVFIQIISNEWNENRIFDQDFDGISLVISQ